MLIYESAYLLGQGPEYDLSLVPSSHCQHLLASCRGFTDEKHLCYFSESPLSGGWVGEWVFSNLVDSVKFIPLLKRFLEKR